MAEQNNRLTLLASEIYPTRHQLSTELGTVSLIGDGLATQAEFEPAARLALAQGNVSCVNGLPGSYTAVLQQGETVEVATDLAAQFGMYWQQTDEDLCLSVDDHNFSGPADTAYLASYILGLPQLVSGQTALEGVGQLQGGQKGRFDSSGLIGVTEPEILPNANFDIDTAAAALHEALWTAVERRVMLPGKLTSYLSGGYDSSTLTLLAAELLGDKGLDAFTNYREGIAVGDVPYAQRIAATRSNIRLYLQVMSEDELPFKNLGQQPTPVAQPDTWMVSNAQLKRQLETLHEYGSDVHLVGTGGDAILSADNFLPDLMQAGDHETLRQFVQTHARLRHLDPKQLEAKVVYDNNRSISDDFRTLAAQLRNPGDPRSHEQSSPYSWLSFSDPYMVFLSSGMRRHLAELAEQQADTQPHRPGNLSNVLSLSSIQACGRTLHYFRRQAAQQNTEVHAPFLDNQVINAVLQTAAYKRTVPGTFKYILGRAFGDFLPQALLDRGSKSMYSQEHYRGLRSSRDDILGLLTVDCHLAALDIIEPKRVIEELYKLDTGQRGHWAINEILAAEIWLRLREKISA